MDITVAAVSSQPTISKESSVDLSAKDSIKQEFSDVYNQEMPKNVTETASANDSPNHDDVDDSELGDEAKIADDNVLPQPQHIVDLPAQATHITLQSLVAESIASNDSSVEDFSDVELDIVVCKQDTPQLLPEQITKMTELASTNQAVSEVLEPWMNATSNDESDFVDEMMKPIVVQQSAVADKPQEIQLEWNKLEASLLSPESNLAELMPQELIQQETPQIVNHISNQSPIAAKQNSPQQVAVNVPMTDNTWREAFSEKVLWLTNQNIKSASVQLNPQELGPIEINIKVNQQQASIVMNAQHGTTRDALLDAMPNLRGLLADNGIQLQEFQIQDGKDQQGRNQEAFYHRDDDVGYANELIEQTTEVKPAKVAATRLNAIDYYA